jgi:restriction system protein
MARRNRNEGLLHLLMESPWWVSVVFSGVVYFGLKYWLPSLWAGSLALSSIAKGLELNAGLFAFIFLVPAPISFIRSLHRRKLLDTQSGLDSIRAMSWRQFEMLCGEAYRRKGFAVEENGLGGADGGIDLMLRRGGETWIVQCKRWKTFKVGVKEVRELYGILAAERADRGIFITCGQYTQDALAFAADKPLDLVDGPTLLELVREVQTHPISAAPRPTPRVEPSFSYTPAPSPSSSPPSCPRCGALMVLRTAKRGGNAGGQFWGCSSFPKCRGIVEAD